jgi:hypothetical protein
MPIKINLLAEAQAEEDLRRRDPVKRAIFGGALVVVLFLVWFSSIFLEHIVDNQHLSSIQAAIQSHTNDYAQVQVKLKKISDAQRKLDALQTLSADRFLQGTLMDAFQHIYVPSVQMTHLRVDQAYTSAGGSGNNSSSTAPKVAATSVERIIITLDAKDSSANPGDQVNHFQDALVQNDFFKANLNSTNGVRLANLSAPQTSFDSKAYVLFTMECRFPDKTR